MKDKIHHPQPLLLTRGYWIDQSYTNIDEMLGASDNWEHHCTYQLLPHGIIGAHQILQLHTMQLTYADRLGGMMNDVVTAKECLTFAVMEESKDKMCFHRTKLRAGDIVFLDDSQAFSFMSNGTIRFCVVTIQNKHLGSLKPLFLKALQHTIQDTDQVLSTLLRNIWEERDSVSYSVASSQKSESEVLKALTTLIEAQIPQLPKLTKGESIALDIRDALYSYMDGAISIESLAKEHQVSEKTLQNSFKSLFGFTPKRFLRLLKLNHVHHELKYLDSKENSVSKVAQKWGFSHMGQFTRYYTELFNENPSHTLKSDCFQKEGMDTSCVMRQDEIE